MPRSGKNNERIEQVPRGRKKPTKIEPLRPQAEHLDKLYNDLAKFPSENPYPIMRIHKDGTVMYANKASEPLLKARGSGMGQPAPAQWRRIVKEILVSGCVAREEVKDNGRVFALRAVPIAENGYVNFYGVDITERKQAEEALRETKEHLEIRVKERTAELEQVNRTLQVEIAERKQAEEAVKRERQRLDNVLETLPAYVVLLSADYHVSFANRFFRERFGESEGRRCYEYLFHRSAPCEICETYTVLKTASPHRWEWTGPDGRNYDIFDFPFTDEDGAPLILEVGIDITERKRAKEVLQQAHNELEQRVAERTEELRQANEELRTDITERKKAEEALRDSESKYRSLFENMLNGYAYCRILSDENGRPTDFVYLDVNDAFEKLTGLKKQNVLGKKATEAIPGIKASHPELFDIYGKVALTGKETNFDVFFKPLERWLSISVYSPQKGYFVAVFENITERKKAEDERELTIGLLRLLNTDNQTHELMKLVTVFLKDWSGCEAVGIRLRDGEDFPYFETSGFPDEFVLAESKLCSLNELGEPVRDSRGRAYLECMCGNIISGRFDPSKPFFTEHGSFWTNSTTDLLAGTTKADRMAKTRNRCNTAGYESVALVPLHTGRETFGLLQFNSKQKDRFTPEKILLLERLADNLAIGLAQRKAEESLRESEDRFKTLADETSDSIVIHDGERILEVNKAFGKIWGCEPQKAVGAKMDEFVTPASLEVIKDRIRSGYDKPYEVIAVRKDGTQFDVEITGKPITYKGRTVRIATAQNITERKRAEQAMRESEKRLRDITFSMADWVWELDENGVYTYSSQKGSDILGRSREDIIGKTPFDFMPPDEAKRVAAIFSEIAANKAPIKDLENWNIRKNGERICLLTNGVPILDEKGNLKGYRGVDKDITERKHAEESLREKSRLNQMLLDAMPCVALLLRPGSREIVALNRAAIEAGAAVGKTCFETWARRETPCPWCLAPEVWATGRASHLVVEYKGIWWDAHWLPIAEDLYMHYAFDITEKKRVEQALRESEGLLRGLFENMTSGAAIYKVINDGSKGSDYIIRDFNAASLRIEGKRKDEVIGKSLFDLRPNIDQYGLIPVLQKVWRTGEPGYFPSTIYVDEKYSNWYENRVYKLPTGEIVAIYDDVTERKKVEELLRGSEERLKAALDAAELGTWDWNLVNGQITWAGHHEQLFGFEEGEFDGRIETFRSRIHPDDLEGLKAAIEKSKAEKSEYFCEYRVIWPDGTVRWMAGKGRCHYDQTGRAVRMLGTVQDITERNILEETLEKERKELVLITDSLPIIAFYKDKEGRFVRVNKTFAEALNTPREKFLGKTVFDFYSAKIAQSMTNDDQEVFRTGRAKLNIVEQYESVRGLRWAQTDKVPIFDKDGILVGLVGFAQDITERRLAEEQLKEERNLLRTVIDHIPDKVYVKDKNSRFVTCNKATLDGEYLKSETEIIGKTDFDLYDRKTAQELFDNEQELMRTGKPSINLECQRIGKTGNLQSALQTKVPLSDSHGNIVGIVGINRDITERTQVEHKLLEHQKHLKQLAARLTLTEERERRRIAGEIHDEISQTLAMVKIKLDTLRNSPPSEASAAEIEEISSSVEKVIQETRTLTFELSNPILYELGFEVAVAEWLNEQVQVKHGIATEFLDDGKSKPLDNDMRILLFRNVRELLINCIKHANAGKVRVGIRRIDGSIEVVVEDNGVGFDPAEIRSTAGKRAKFGLFSIRESLESLGGHFEIESKPGAGCKAIMTAPFKDQSHKKEV